MTAQQELVENQHPDQFHLDELTGVKTPIREFLATEVHRIKGVLENDAEVEAAKAEAEKVKADAIQLVEDAKVKTEDAKAAALKLIDDAKAEAEKVRAALETENTKLKAELEALKAKPAPKAQKAAESKPAATAVRETGDVK